MTERERRQNLACLQCFIAKLNESVKLLESERIGKSCGEKSYFVFIFYWL